MVHRLSIIMFYRIHNIDNSIKITLSRHEEVSKVISSIDALDNIDEFDEEIKTAKSKKRKKGGIKI